MLYNKIKIYRIDIASNESTSDLHQISVSKKTYFESYFDITGDGRKELLRIKNHHLVRKIINSLLPNVHSAMVLVNSNQYGGSGSWHDAPVFSSAKNAYKVGIHELCHSYFSLADEYDGTHVNYNRTFANVTDKINRSEIKWKDLIDTQTPIPTYLNPKCGSGVVNDNIKPGTVGLFQGANYSSCKWYRPEQNCLMRSTGYYRFCAVCEREIEHKIMSDIHII